MQVAESFSTQNERLLSDELRAVVVAPLRVQDHQSLEQADRLGVFQAESTLAGL